MIEFIQNIKNIIDFNLRNFLKISRKTINSVNSEQQYLENLYLFEILEKYLQAKEKGEISIIDVGCKNWSYVQAEYQYFKQFCNKLTLDGIELDANRLYTNLVSRGETAKLNIKNIKNANYIAGDFLNNDKKYDYIIWILPFLFKYSLLKWGLPKAFFQPEKMLMHAYNSLNIGGKILIINQEYIEYQKQKELCNRLKLSFEDIGEIKSISPAFKQNRYAIVIKD